MVLIGYREEKRLCIFLKVKITQGGGGRGASNGGSKELMNGNWDEVGKLGAVRRVNLGNYDAGLEFVIESKHREITGF